MDTDRVGQMLEVVYRKGQFSDHLYIYNLHGERELHLDIEREELWVDSLQKEKLIKSLSTLQEKYDSLKAKWYQSYLLSLCE